MASSLSISRASSIMSSILDRTIYIPRDISFKGEFTLIDKFSGDSDQSKSTLTRGDLMKLVEVTEGTVFSNKTLIVDSKKDISGINNQTNTGILTFDNINNTESENLIFKRARGNTTTKSEPHHNNNIGSLLFQSYINNSPELSELEQQFLEGNYYKTASIDFVSYQKSYDGHIGSEIIFSNSGGSDINKGKHESLKIDARGNLNILKNKEMRLNCFTNNNFSGFRPSISTVSPGYIMELPPSKGEQGDILKINKIGSGCQLRLISNSNGVIVEPVSIINSGIGYDPNYLPEVNTNINMTGGQRKENGRSSTDMDTSINDRKIYLSSNAKGTISDYYNGWTIETINPNFKRIIIKSGIDTNDNNYAIVSYPLNIGSSIKETTTSTEYKLTEGHISASISRESNIVYSTVVAVAADANQRELYLTSTTGSVVKINDTVSGTNIPSGTIVSSVILQHSGAINEGTYKVTLNNDIETGGLTINQSIDFTSPNIVYTLDILSGPSLIDNYYLGWTITVDYNNTLYEGEVTAYHGATRVIAISWINEIPHSVNMLESRFNQSGRMTGILTLDSNTTGNLINWKIKLTNNGEIGKILSYNNITKVIEVDWMSSQVNTDVGIPENTTIDTVTGDGRTITLSNMTTSYIPAQTVVYFTGTPTPSPTSGVIENNVEAGTNVITLSSVAPTGTSINISIMKPLYQLQEPFVCSLINKKITPASIVVTSVNNNGGINGVSLIDGGNGYIPDRNITVNLSSQTRLGWTQHTLETLGVDKIEGTCVGGFRGSSAEAGYIIIEGTSHLIDDGVGSSPLNGIISNASWIVELTNKDTNLQPGWTKYYGHIYHYDHSNRRIYINRGNSSNQLPEVNNNTLYKLVRYTEGGKTGGASGGNGISTESSKTLGGFSNGTSPLYPPASSIGNYYQGWLLLSYGNGVYDINNGFTGVITYYVGSTTANTATVAHLATGGQKELYITSETGDSVKINDTVTGNNIAPDTTVDNVVLQGSNDTNPGTYKVTLNNNIETGGLSLDQDLEFTPLANVANVVITNNSNTGTFNATENYVLSNTRPYGTNLTTGPGLSGGGNMANNITVNLDLTTHDANGDTSNYIQNNTTDKILLCNPITGSKLPTLNNFLTNISGDGIMADNNGLNISGNQKFTTNRSDYLKLYPPQEVSGSSPWNTYYLNVGKNDTDNLKVKGEYDENDNLKLTTIKSQSSIPENNSSIDFDIGEKNILNINKKGISVKRGIIENITITGSSGYTSTPTVVLPPSPLNAEQVKDLNFNATAECIINSSGEIESIIITNSGLGYSSSSSMSSDEAKLVGGGGTYNTMSVTVDETHEIIGQINNENLRYNGYFNDLTIFGDQQFEGTLKVEGQGAVQIGKPSNLAFSEDDSNFLFGYEPGRGGIRLNANQNVTLTGYKSGYMANENSHDNTFYGSNSGYNNRSGYRNTLIGSYAGEKIQDDSYNTCVGYKASYFIKGDYNTTLGSYLDPDFDTGNPPNSYTGEYNVLLGYNTKTKGGNYNTYVGAECGENATSNNGVFIGYKSGYSSTGTGNVSIGSESGHGIISGEYNVNIGYKSGKYIEGGIQNICIGPASGPSDLNKDLNNRIYIDTVGPVGGGDEIGSNSLIYGNQDETQELSFNADVTISNQSINSSGNLTVQGGTITFAAGMKSENLAADPPVGQWWKINSPAGGSQTSKKDTNIQIVGGDGGMGWGYQGYHNTFVGYQITAAGGGGYNSIFGSSAGRSMTTGSNNAIVGYDAGYYQTTALNNTLIGMRAGYQLSTGGNNTAVGQQTARYITTGTCNTIIGFKSGWRLENNSNYNVCLGYYAGPDSETELNNRVYIDASGTNDGKGENSLIYGNQDGVATLSFNADVTISNQDSNSSGNLTVEGGTITFAGELKSEGDTEGLNWKINAPSHSAAVGMNKDSNIQIVNEGAGMPENQSSYHNVFMGYGIAAASSPSGMSNTIIGSQAGNKITTAATSVLIGRDAGKEITTATGNTIIGRESGHGVTTGDLNTIVGQGAARILTTGQQNTIIGQQAGCYLTGQSNHNICIGQYSGPISTEGAVSRRVYIDARNVTQKGEDCLIYGNQDGVATLSFNADVTISNQDANSSGNLTVDGNLTVGSINAEIGSITRYSGKFTSLSITDNNIDINPTNRNSLDNLLLTNNSNNVSFTGISQTTIFGTFSSQIDITNGSQKNTIFGHDCGPNITTGKENILIGVDNNSQLTTGEKVISIGCGNSMSATTLKNCIGIGYNNMTNIGNDAIHNIAIGHDNCKYITHNYNIGIGKNCINATSADGSASSNICLGSHTGEFCVGSNNYLIGSNAGRNITNNYNCGIGYMALEHNRSGSYNVALGMYALRGHSTSGSQTHYNVGIGQQVGYNLTTGDDNVFIGRYAGLVTQSGYQNVFLGYSAGRYNVGGVANISIGYFAGRQTSGHRNISIGYNAGPRDSEKTHSDRLYIDNARAGATSLIYGRMDTNSVTINGHLTVTGGLSLSSASISTDIVGGVSVPSNKSLGIYTFNNITVGGSTTNIYLGYNTAASGRTNSSAQRNTYLGYQAGRYQTSGNHNTLIGSEAGYYINTGSVNTFVGNRAGYTNQTGNNNCTLGHYSGYYMKGSSNIIIGYNAGPTGTSTASNYLYIDPVTRRGSDSLIYGYGYGSRWNSRYVRINGSFRVYGSSSISYGWSTWSDITLKKNIKSITIDVTDKINNLNPVNFTWIKNNQKDLGFIAQEVKKIFPSIVKTDKDNLLTINYSKLTPFLVKGMQESNQKIKDLEDKLEAEKNAREQMEKIFREEIEKLRKEIIQK